MVCYGLQGLAIVWYSLQRLEHTVGQVEIICTHVLMTHVGCKQAQPSLERTCGQHQVLYGCFRTNISDGSPRESMWLWGCCCRHSVYSRELRGLSFYGLWCKHCATMHVVVEAATAGTVSTARSYHGVFLFWPLVQALSG